MSVKQPQSTCVAFAILTLFAAAAWGQQKGADIPVYESDNAIFGAHRLSNEDLFLKAALEEDIEEPESATKTASHAKRVSANQNPQIDSLFGASQKQLVDYDGYFIAAAEGSMWKDVTADPAKTLATGNEVAGQAASSILDASNGDAVSAAPVAAVNSGNAINSVNGLEAARSSKLRLRIGFDALVFQRSRAENTVFAVDDNGQQWAFSDFDFTEGDARYFVQFMGDDQSGLEFTFFDFKSFSSTLNASGENVVPFFFQGSPADQATQYDLRYTSRLKNIELNSWIRKNAFQRTGYGVRHINLDENFDVLIGGNVENGLFSRTNNDLWGLNRMWERRRPMLNRLTAVGGLDAGLYLNKVKVNVDTENIDDSSEATNVAGSLGFNIGAEYLVADHVTLRFGYEGLGIFGVGTGSAQSLGQDVFNGLNDPELSSVYFGGFYIGAIASF